MVSIPDQLRSKIIPYLVIKLSGAGLSLAVFFTFMLMLSEFEMNEFVDIISNWQLWSIFFGYGIACSVCIDLITWKIERRKRTLRTLLYVFAGYAFFLVYGFNVSTFIAGTVGALCAILFYFGTVLCKEKPPLQSVFAFVFPLIFIILMNVDFTEKVKWTEVQSGSTFTASFDFFDGKHEIPIRATEGQTITLSIEVTNQNGGGYGFHVLDEKDQYVGMMEESEGKMKIHVQRTGIYRIVLTGDNLRGSFKVTWNIDETKTA